MIVPLGSEAGQQMNSMMNGRFMYTGGFEKQPIKSLTGAHALSNVRSLFGKLYDRNGEAKDWSKVKLSKLDEQLHRMVTSGT